MKKRRWLSRGLTSAVFWPCMGLLLFGFIQEGGSELITPRAVTGDGVFNNQVRFIIDGQLVGEKTPGTGENCVHWKDPEATFVVDLGGEFMVTGILIEVDDNDDYHIEYSLDGEEYFSLVIFASGLGETGVGMDIKSNMPGHPHYVLTPETEPVQARYIRLSARGGDQAYAVAEIQAWGFASGDRESGDNDLIQPQTVQGSGNFSNNAGLMIDGQIPPEGSKENSEACVFWDNPDTVFTIDLGDVYQLSGVLIQADGNDSYRIDYSLNGRDYFALCEIRQDMGEIETGMETICTLPDHEEYITDLDFFPVQAKYIKIYVDSGEGMFSVSEVQIYGKSLSSQ